MFVEIKYLIRNIKLAFIFSFHLSKKLHPFAVKEIGDVLLEHYVTFSNFVLLWFGEVI